MSLDGSGHDLDTLLRVRNIKASAPRHNRRHANPQQQQEAHNEDGTVFWWAPDLIPANQPLPEPSNSLKLTNNKDDKCMMNAQKEKDDDSVKKPDQEQDQDNEEESQKKEKKEDAEKKKDGK